MEILDFGRDLLLVLLDYPCAGGHRHIVAAELQDDEAGVRKFEALRHQGFADAVENGAGAAPQRDVVHGDAFVSIGPNRVDFRGAAHFDGGLFHGLPEGPGAKDDVVFFRHGLHGFQRIADGFGAEVLAGATVEDAHAGEGFHPFAGVFVARGPQVHGAATLDYLRQDAVAVMPGPDGGGIPVHGVLHETTGSTLGDAGRRHVTQRREESRADAAELLLQLLPQVLRDAVHFNLRVSIVHYAHGSIGLFGLPEEAVEELVVVPRQVDAVRIIVEELAVILEGVFIGHFEAAFHLIQHGVHVHLLLIRVPDILLQRCKAQRKRPQRHAIGRRRQPQRPQQREYAHNKE